MLCDSIVGSGLETGLGTARIVSSSAPSIEKHSASRAYELYLRISGAASGVCVSAHACAYIHIHTCTYNTYLWVNMYISLYICRYTYACMHVRMCIYIHIHVCVYAHVYTHVYTHVCMYVYICNFSIYECVLTSTLMCVRTCMYTLILTTGLMRGIHG